jgi:hypothetical protein
VHRAVIRVGRLQFEASEIGRHGAGRSGLHIPAVRVPRSIAVEGMPLAREFPKELEVSFGSPKIRWARVLVLQTVAAESSASDEVDEAQSAQGQPEPVLSLNLDPV